QPLGAPRLVPGTACVLAYALGVRARRVEDPLGLHLRVEHVAVDDHMSPRARMRRRAIIRRRAGRCGNIRRALCVPPPRCPASALMMTAVFLSRVIGYLRDAFIGARFGASNLTDAYFAAFTLPDFLNMLVAGGTLSITFLPIYSRYLAEGKPEEANRVLSIAM